MLFLEKLLLKDCSCVINKNNTEINLFDKFGKNHSKKSMVILKINNCIWICYDLQGAIRLNSLQRCIGMSHIIRTTRIATGYERIPGIIEKNREIEFPCLLAKLFDIFANALVVFALLFPSLLTQEYEYSQSKKRKAEGVTKKIKKKKKGGRDTLSHRGLHNWSKLWCYTTQMAEQKISRISYQKPKKHAAWQNVFGKQFRLWPDDRNLPQRTCESCLCIFRRKS